jgi:hypothetical protein
MPEPQTQPDNPLGIERHCRPSNRSVLVRAPLGRFLPPVGFELSKHLLRIWLFRLPDLFSQPFQLGELLEQIR